MHKTLSFGVSHAGYEVDKYQVVHAHTIRWTCWKKNNALPPHSYRTSQRVTHSWPLTTVTLDTSVHSRQVFSKGILTNQITALNRSANNIAGICVQQFRFAANKSGFLKGLNCAGLRANQNAVFPRNFCVVQSEAPTGNCFFWGKTDCWTFLKWASNNFWACAKS